MSTSLYDPDADAVPDDLDYVKLLVRIVQTRHHFVTLLTIHIVPKRPLFYHSYQLCDRSWSITISGLLSIQALRQRFRDKMRL